MAPLGNRVTGERRRRFMMRQRFTRVGFEWRKKIRRPSWSWTTIRRAYNLFELPAPEGFVVFTGADGRAAIDKASTLGPDIIVMDLAMPRVDGFEAIRKFRASSWTRRIPIIAISAVPLSQEMALSAGCDAYLAKPLDPEALWLQIRSMLRLSNMPSPA